MGTRMNEIPANCHRTVFVVTEAVSPTGKLPTVTVLGVFCTELVAYGTAKAAMLEWAKQNNAVSDDSTLTAVNEAAGYCGRWQVNSQEIPF